MHCNVSKNENTAAVDEISESSTGKISDIFDEKLREWPLKEQLKLFCKSTFLFNIIELKQKQIEALTIIISVLLHLICNFINLKLVLNSCKFFPLICNFIGLNYHHPD